MALRFVDKQHCAFFDRERVSRDEDGFALAVGKLRHAVLCAERFMPSGYLTASDIFYIVMSNPALASRSLIRANSGRCSALRVLNVSQSSASRMCLACALSMSTKSYSAADTR